MRGRSAAAAGMWFAAVLAGEAAAGVGPPAPVPEQGDLYDLYLGLQEQYDGNLFRLAPERSAFSLVSPQASRSDQLTTASAGGDLQRILGRQTVVLDLHADENRFSRNGFLNNTSGYANLLLDWEVGPYFSGTAYARYSHSLVSFGEALYLGRDLIDTSDFAGTARYQLGPHWAVYGGIGDSNIAHSAEAARTGNFQTKAGNVGVEYAYAAADSVGFEYRYDEGTFRSGQVYTFDGFDFSPNFHDDRAVLILKHAFSDKSQLTVEGGYQKRFYPNTLVGSFAGDIGRLSFNWQPTEKTQLLLASWRELHAYLVSQSNYFVSTGGSLTPSWFVTEKLSVSAMFSYEKQDYIPESISVVALGPLSAKVAVERLNVNWSPRDNWSLSLSYIHSTRSSNAVSFQYGDDLASFSILYKTR